MKSVIEFSDKAFSEIAPDAVIVQGDTTTAMSVAISAFYRNIPVGHLEAGLRTGNLQSPYPEEANRKIITQIANWKFAPTKSACDNLLGEGVDPQKVFMVGNSVIDALLLRSHISESDPGVATDLEETLGFSPIEKEFVLVTCHRRENFGKPVREILRTLSLLAKEHEGFHFVYPAHPNPEIQNAVVEAIDPEVENLHVLQPLNYSQMVYLLEHCFLVLTDSGGIQEEAPTFKKPILILRDTTERPEVLEHGMAKLVGASREKIMKEVKACINDSDYYASFIGNSNPFGDGSTSQQVADILEVELFKR
jgi:UDP-N-acetylglucosamine 2-epimerase (non-hydrolysing)